MTGEPEPLIEFGVAEWALNGESGDLAVVETFPGGALVAVVDGLGHGPDAAAASEAAKVVIVRHAQADPVAILRACHDALTRTRGVVASLSSIRAGTMTWAGVGNVEGLLTRPDDAAARTLAPRGGVLGHALPRPYSSEVSLEPRDTLVLATDGIVYSSLWDVSHRDSAQRNADRILAGGCKGSDDALVLVVRYTGGPA